MGTAYFKSKLKKAINNGTTAPPPPIPDIVDKAIITAITKQPTYSFGSIGNTSLCLHFPST